MVDPNRPQKSKKTDQTEYSLELARSQVRSRLLEPRELVNTPSSRWSQQSQDKGQSMTTVGVCTNFM